MVYPSKQTRMNFIQYAKWSVNQGASFCYFYILLFQCLYLYNLYNFILQYFHCLPLKYDTYEFHSIRKMISDSRRIFFVFTNISVYIYIYMCNYIYIYIQIISYTHIQFYIIQIQCYIIQIYFYIIYIQFISFKYKFISYIYMAMRHQ